MTTAAPRITIAGLGPGAADYLSRQTLDALRAASCVLLRTERHPAVAALAGMGIRYRTCDDLYETHDTFEAVYQAIVARVLELAARHGDVVYAVPGDPMVAEQAVRLLLALPGERPGLQVEVQPSLGALNLIFARLRLDPGDGFLLADARDPRVAAAGTAPRPEAHGAYHGAMPLVNPTLPTIWFQVDTALVAGDLKLALLEWYPPEHPVTVLTAIGAGADETVVTLPLAELDRGGTAITHLTSLHVPALAWPRRRHTLTDLRAIMAMLRSEHGCPWDREQDMRSLRRTIIEEAYELVDAIDRDEPHAIADELGDLLLNVIFVAQLGAEEGVFTFDDAVEALADKLIRRHAHVFGDIEADTAAAVLRSWEQIKAGERESKGEASLFADVALALPALQRSQKLQKRAARVGFDWLDFRGPLMKLHEELEELSHELGITESWERPALLQEPFAPLPELDDRVAGAPRGRLVHEVGDIFFAAVNLCRFLHLDAEEVMREANDRFVRRFQRLEAAVHARGQRVDALSLEQLDEIWLEIKGGD